LSAPMSARSSLIRSWGLLQAQAALLASSFALLAPLLALTMAGGSRDGLALRLLVAAPIAALSGMVLAWTAASRPSAKGDRQLLRLSRFAFRMGLVDLVVFLGTLVIAMLGANSIS